MARSTKVTIEIDSLLIVRGSRPISLWCPQCASEVEMIAFEEAQVLSSVLPRELAKWLNSGALHRFRPSGGAELICLNSLLNHLKGR